MIADSLTTQAEFWHSVHPTWPVSRCIECALDDLTTILDQKELDEARDIAVNLVKALAAKSWGKAA